MNDLKKETIGAIAKHFHKKKIGWFNKWHFLKVTSDLPEHIKKLMGEKMAPPVRRIDQCQCFLYPQGILGYIRYFDVPLFLFEH